MGSAIIVILALGYAAGSMLETYNNDIGFAEEADRIAEILEVQPGISVGDVRTGTGRCSR